MSHQDLFIAAGCDNTATASGGSGISRSGGFKDRLGKYCSGMLQVELYVPQGEGWLTQGPIQLHFSATCH